MISSLFHCAQHIPYLTTLRIVLLKKGTLWVHTSQSSMLSDSETDTYSASCPGFPDPRPGAKREEDIRTSRRPQQSGPTSLIDWCLSLWSRARYTAVGLNGSMRSKRKIFPVPALAGVVHRRWPIKEDWRDGWRRWLQGGNLAASPFPGRGLVCTTFSVSYILPSGFLCLTS